MHPVALAASALFIGLAGVSGAFAQSTTTGTIYGQVKAEPGTTITLENVGTGAKRTLTPDTNGRFQATALPPGTYKVSVLSGNAVVRTDLVDLLAGQGSEVDFTAAATGTQRIDVVGRIKTIDVSQSNSGATFTARELERLPIQQTVASVVQLAPNTTKADFRYGNNAASFGGSGSSENAIYLNGFTITNGLYQVGYSSLPFGAISQINVLTGGYGAEFGRSTGGVINITTKSGTNDYEFSAGLSISPSALRAKPKNIVYPMTGTANNAATDGKIYYYKQGDNRDEQTFNLSMSGPIIKDKLFFYAGAELSQYEQSTTRSSSASTSAGTTGWLQQFSNVPRGILKLDWHITDNHLLEYTGVRDKSKVEDNFYGFNYATLTPGTTKTGGASFVNYAAGVPFLTATGAAMSAAQGADLNILKYTGYLTDDLTIQALIGTSKTPRKQTPIGLIPGQYQVTAPINSRAPGINYIPTQPQLVTGSILRDGAEDTNTGGRFDIEYKLTRQHTLRGGIDSNNIKAVNGNALAGGGRWDYLKTPNGTDLLAGMTATPGSTGSPLGALGYYVDEVKQVTGGTPQVKQAAQYIEDRFQVTPNLLVTLGLRNEQFNNLNSTGESIIKKDRQLAPRLSAAWDVNGDASMKVFGTAGRYHLQIPANLAVRFASGSLNTERFYTYTGVDPVTGAPLGLVPIGNVYSANREFGVPPDARTIAATDIKSNTQDEFTIGFEKALSREWNGGMRFNYRKLVSSIDDVSDTRPIAAKLTNPAEAAYFSNNWNGALFNPGQSNTFLVPVDANGTLRQVTVAWNEWGFPESLKRTYWALDFMLEHPFRNGWYGKINYTLSKSTGNTEGQQKSDNGQADVGFTSVWDFPELMINSNGPLPNSRRHQIKAYGVYQLTSELSVSGNFQAASGRPRSCTANLPAAQDPLGIGGQYGSIFFVCPNAPGRGALGTLPWETRLDLGFAFRPEALPGLTMKVDIYNVFNKQTVTSINEELNLRAAGATVSGLSQQEQNYSAPRAVTFAAQYTKKF
jgi:hypothetical protein